MNISPINFTARAKFIKRGEIIKNHEFRAPQDYAPSKSYKQRKIKHRAPKSNDIYTEQMEDMLVSNPNNSVAKMLLKEFSRNLGK